MARPKPGSIRSLANDFQRNLLTEERTSRARPMATNSGNEQQSELVPNYTPPKRSAAPARPRPAGGGGAPRRTAPPLPPRRPPPGPPKFGDPTETGGITPPYIPGTMPQYDPMGNPTGPSSPGAPGSSTLGYPPMAQPNDMVPPLTGPNSDRGAGIAPGMSPGDAWAAKVNTALPPMPQGQSGLSAVLGALAPSPAWAAQQNAAGMPPQGPPMPAPPIEQQAAMAPPDRPMPGAPPGIIDQVNSGIAGAGDWLKRNVPPLRF